MIITKKELIEIETNKKMNNVTIHPLDVLLYTLLYAAFFGFVNHPYPFGALTPKLCLTILFTEVRADILLLNDGVLNPYFII